MAPNPLNEFGHQNGIIFPKLKVPASLCSVSFHYFLPWQYGDHESHRPSSPHVLVALPMRV